MSSSNGPLIIAHRGETTLAPENTIEACKLAIESGAQGLEVDVRLCGSGDVVLFHDKLLYNHFGKYKPVYLSTLKELKSLEFTSAHYHVPGRISSLAEFFEEFKGRVPINLDAKTFYADVRLLATSLIKEIERFEIQDQIWVSSFNPFFLKLLKLAAPTMRTGYLFAKMTGFHAAIDVLLKSEAWHPHFSLINDELIEMAGQRKKEIYTWTVNEPDDYERMKKYDVEGIITDMLFKP